MMVSRYLSYIGNYGILFMSGLVTDLRFNQKTNHFFFFFNGRGWGIRTCDLYFIRRGSQPIELPLETNHLVNKVRKK
jgi:hypothetical protein